MSLKAEIKQIFYDLEILKEPGRDEIAHFCRHQGIRVWFSRTRTTWHSIGPSAIKPWWMILEPVSYTHLTLPTKVLGGSSRWGGVDL